MRGSDRKLEVLRAIVEDFVLTGEPVGSKALVDRHNLAVSAATIRNDMAALEDEGLITAPHTSAGRVPTDAGYRRFVDQLADLKPLSPAERRAIAAFLLEAVDLDDVVHRAVRALAQLTRNVAVMQYPTLSRSRVRHVEVVALAPARIMLVLITDTGRVEQRLVELAEPQGEQVVADLRNTLNAALRDRLLVDAPGVLADLPTAVAPGLRAATGVLASALLEAVVERRSDRVVLAGTANLSDHSVDFPAIRPVLEALEEQMVLLKLLDSALTPGGVVVRIGTENPHQGLAATSVVTTGYGPDGAALGAVGVLGPRRMDYASTMGRVAAVARYIGQIIAEG